MAKTGLQNEQIISELLVNGSQAIDTKNEFGVYLFEERNVEDGIVSEKLVKPKYDKDELQRAIDTNITELLPGIPSTNNETVPKYLYDAKQAEVDMLVLDIEELQNQITTLEATITGLETDLENMRNDMDNKDLLLAQAQNQSQQSNAKVGSSISELQNSIQRATSEAVERTSLLAKNESLQAQIVTYQKQLDTAAKQIESAQTQLTNQNNTINSLTANSVRQGLILDIAQQTAIDASQKSWFEKLGNLFGF